MDLVMGMSLGMGIGIGMGMHMGMDLGLVVGMGLGMNTPTLSTPTLSTPTSAKPIPETSTCTQPPGSQSLSLQELRLLSSYTTPQSITCPHECSTF